MRPVNDWKPDMRSALRKGIPLLGLLAAAGTLPAQFLEEFNAGDAGAGSTPPGWTCATGDGQAGMDFVENDGYATIHVDATGDRQGIWWALIRRPVPGLDMERLVRPGYELRAEARIRVSHAPRRVNLHFNHQRTTDYHSHLMEFDIPEADTWHTISMTTRNFEVRADDQVNAQLALMDWGQDRYTVDIDYFKVDVVPAAMVEKDLGHPLPYHPPIPDPASFAHRLTAAQDGVVDRQFPDLNFGDWASIGEDGPVPVLAVSGTQLTILRWEPGEFRGRRVAGPGLLVLGTRSLQRSPRYAKDFGMVRVKEILGGDPDWEADSVTMNSLLSGAELNAVINSQMVIDYPVTADPDGKSYFVINEQVMNRLLSGETRGLAIFPLGAVNAAFHTGGADDAGLRPALLFNLQ